MSSKQCACGSLAYRRRNECLRCVRIRHKANLVRKSTDRPLEPVAPVSVPPAEQVTLDREQNKLRAELKVVKAKYQESLKTIEAQEASLSVVAELKEGLETHTIEPHHPSGTSEATVVVVASDWHIEETVGAEVGGLNKFNLAIAHTRAERFFAKAHRLTTLLAQDVKIPTMILALLGDFISGHIHDELVENNSLSPMHAIVEAQNLLASGIQFLLDNSDRKIHIPCHSGNHSRTTLKTRFATENGHSLEYLLYVTLADHFRHEPRVTIQIA